MGGVDLVERAVIERRKAPSKPKEGEEAVPDLPVVCWDKRIVEDQGLVKMDILGLQTMDVIDLILNPKLSRDDQILAVPTLVRKLPVPVRKIIGDLSNREHVLVGLDLMPRTV